MSGDDEYSRQVAHLGDLAGKLRQAQAAAAVDLDPARRALEVALNKAWDRGRGMSKPAIREATGQLFTLPMLTKIVGPRPAKAPRRGRPGTPEQLAELAEVADAYRAARTAADQLTEGPRDQLIEALRAAWDDGRGMPKNHLLHAIDNLWTRVWLDTIVGTVPGQHGVRRGWAEPGQPPRGATP